MPKVIDRDSYRSALLARAVKSFSDKGFEALSMKQLAGALGISHALFYHYFESKQALFLQMTEQLAQDLLGDLTGPLEPSQPLDEKLRRIFARAEARDRDLLQLYRLIGDYARVAEKSESHNNTSLESVVSSVRNGFQASLGVNDTQMDLLFTYALGVLQGRGVYPSGVDYARHRELIVALVNSRVFATLGGAGANA